MAPPILEDDIETENLYYPLIAPPRNPSAEEWAQIASSGNFESLFFDWYRFVGSIANALANIMPESDGFLLGHRHSYYVLSGLIFRCARLMMSHIALSHEGKNGETTSIIDRCLTESAITLRWICHRDTESRVRRYICHSLKPEVEFEAEIRARVEAKKNKASPIEERMLKSIRRSMQSGDVNESDILKSKKLPQISQMLEELGADRLDYVISQRLASHHIHGSWVSLISQYLDHEENADWAFRPHGRDVPTHANQYMHGMRHVLEACATYARTCLNPDDDAFSPLCDDTWVEILAAYEHAIKLGMR